MAEVEDTVRNSTSADHQATSAPNEPSSQASNTTDPNFPSTSLSDSGLSKRPRDARLLHMILANYGVNAYQERVPLQLMDFAYRYTSSTLSDAQHFTSDVYGTAGPGTTTGKGTAHNDLSSITLPALRLSIHSRTHYQFNPTLPKETYAEIAQERNRVALPSVQREWGMRLPPEPYCLTGTGWDLKEEWDEEMEETEATGDEDDATVKDDAMDHDGEEEGDGEVERMEDLFGEGINGTGGDDDMDEG